MWPTTQAMRAQTCDQEKSGFATGFGVERELNSFQDGTDEEGLATTSGLDEIERREDHCEPGITISD